MDNDKANQLTLTTEKEKKWMTTSVRNNKHYDGHHYHMVSFSFQRKMGAFESWIALTSVQNFKTTLLS